MLNPLFCNCIYAVLLKYNSGYFAITYMVYMCCILIDITAMFYMIIMPFTWCTWLMIIHAIGCGVLAANSLNCIAVVTCYVPIAMLLSCCNYAHLLPPSKHRFYTHSLYFINNRILVSNLGYLAIIQSYIFRWKIDKKKKLY